MSLVDAISPKSASGNDGAIQPIFGTMPRPPAPLSGDLLLDEMTLEAQGYDYRRRTAAGYVSLGPTLDALRA